MASVKTIRIKKDDLEFSYKVSVNTEGEFTTTLPANIVLIFEKAGIELSRNRVRNSGFFVDDTLAGLSGKVSLVVKEYFSRELIETKIVIKYCINTTCSYCLDKKGDICPNGSNEWVGSDTYGWIMGTTPHHASEPGPFGFEVYAQPLEKKTYSYKSGTKKIEYDRVEVSRKEKPYLYHLKAFPNIRPSRRMKVVEIDYNENVAKFFVDLLNQVCKLNEKIKDMIDPESILKIAESGQKLLG